MPITKWVRKFLNLRKGIPGKTLSLSETEKRSTKKNISLIKISRESPIPASAFQQRLFLHHINNPQSVGPILISAREINDSVNLEYLNQSVRACVKQNEVLRTRFYQSDHLVYQKIIPISNLKGDIEFFDLSSMKQTHQDDLILGTIGTAKRKRFDLERESLFRFFLFKISAKKFLFVYLRHHAIDDGVAGGFFFNEVSTNYKNLCSGKPVTVFTTKFEYADYAAWERANLTDIEAKSHSEYWKKTFSNVPECLHLPLDRKRPSIIGTNYKIEKIGLPIELTQKMKDVAKETGISPFQFNLACYILFLHRISSDPDLCVGFPVTMRRALGLGDMKGPFVNNLVIRSRLDLDTSVKNFFSIVSKNFREAISHSFVPVDQIIDSISPSQQGFFTPIYQASWVDTGDPLIDKENIFRNSSHYTALLSSVGEQGDDLVGRFVDGAQGAYIFFHYNADLFEEYTIMQFLSIFLELLDAVTKDSSMALGSLPSYRAYESNSKAG